MNTEGRAQAMEARSGETEGLDPKGDSAVGAADAPNNRSTPETAPTGEALTDNEYLLAMIDDQTFAGVPEIRRHHERIISIAAKLAALSAHPAPPNPQPDGGYPGCDVCACPRPGRCQQNVAFGLDTAGAHPAPSASAPAVQPVAPANETGCHAIHPPEFPPMPKSMASWPKEHLWAHACLTGYRCGLDRSATPSAEAQPTPKEN